MSVLNYEERLEKSKEIPRIGQRAVMAGIPQFNELAICNIAQVPSTVKTDLKAVVFNMERGVNLKETIDFLLQCPDLRDIDIILANELDDGCERSNQLDTTKEIASRLGLNYVYGLEFVELVNKNDTKGFHGNAIMSKWPITWAKAFYPEQSYDWYYSEQIRIGARLAIFAKALVAGKEIGLITAHLENRTDPAGRLVQMKSILDEARKYFSDDMPMILGGDLNTYMFVDHGAQNMIDFLEQTKDKTLDLMKEEPLLELLKDEGYDITGCNSIDVSTCRDRLDGRDVVGARLDWIMSKNMKPIEHGTISTLTKDCTFADPNSSLAKFSAVELSDHDAVWLKAEI